jgi:hypothetical protein
MKKVSKKKKFLFFFLLFFFSFSLPLTAYFVNSNGDFDGRGMAWWDIEVKKDSGGDQWWNIDMGSKGGDWAKTTGTSTSTTTTTTKSATPASSSSSVTVKVDKFTIEPSKVEAGGSVNVSWSASNAKSCTLYRDGLASQPAGASESRKVNITVGPGTYKYELVCKDSSGKEAKLSRTLTVTSSGGSSSGATSTVKINKFLINPAVVNVKGSVDVSWQADNATSCTLYRDGLASLPASNSESRKVNITVGPGTYKYDLVCKNASGSDARLSKTLKVEGVEDSSSSVKISKFTIEPSRIEEGGMVTVSWSSEGALSCTLNGHAVGTKDSQKGMVSQGVGKHDYELICRNAAGNEARLTRSLNVTGAVSSFTSEWQIGNCGRLDGKVFAQNVNGWSSNSFCSLGSPEPASPLFPEPGKTVSWKCVGTVWPATCSASRKAGSATSAVSVDLVPGLVEGCVTDDDCRGQAPYEKCFENTCLRGNVNNDGRIGMGDFVTFKKDFIQFKRSGWSEDLRRSDIKIDGSISMADYSLFVKSYRAVNKLD